jgi:undecaprenyl-diphosphatase
VAIALALVGGVMFAADRRTQRLRGIQDIGVADAVFIGLAQSVALFPGVSRSGATMSVGLFRHLTRDAAARFAFLLGTPAFIGAAVLRAKDLTGVSGHEGLELGIGFLCSAIVGVFVIHYLMRFLRTRTLMPFIYYRFAVAGATLLIGAIRLG